jgi:assimilatory nitrate reductase catalytic subunit
VGLKTITAAIADQALTSVEAVGAALAAGTNCGSCRPAIKRLIGEAEARAHG